MSTPLPLVPNMAPVGTLWIQAEIVLTRACKVIVRRTALFIPALPRPHQDVRPEEAPAPQRRLLAAALLFRSWGAAVIICMAEQGTEEGPFTAMALCLNRPEKGMRLQLPGVRDRVPDLRHPGRRNKFGIHWA